MVYCHGTRQGFEQKWFSKNLECKVIGTEISDNANDYKNTIEWDFHNVKKEWIGSVDFIYSNALDHSYDPNKCLKFVDELYTKRWFMYNRTYIKP